MPRDRRLAEVRFEAMGTSCHLLGIGLDSDRLAAATAWLAERGERFSRFLASSELSRFNNTAGTWAPVSEELEHLLRAALVAWKLSAGMVHAGVLGSMLAIGYGRSLREGRTSVALAEAKPPPPLPDMLELGAGRARLARGTGIDLGGIAKGWLADRLCERLGGNCVANLGGDLFCLGEGPDGAGWPVAVGGMTVLLRDQGAATSGTWRRSWDDAGQHLHHLIDPRTGRPSESTLTEVSAVAGSGFEAEVIAKTGLLLGADGAAAYLAGHAAAWRAA